MLREISNELTVGLKDRLRDVRHLIRSHRHDNAASTSGQQSGQTLQSPEMLLGRAASLLDEALTTAESISLSIISPRNRGDLPSVQSFNVYFSNRASGVRAFRHDMYALAKDALRRLHATVFLIHESAFLTVHTRFESKHGALLKAVTEAKTEDARITAAAKAIAALYREMRAERPIRFQSYSAQNQFETLSLSAICLAVGLATAKPSEIESIDYIEGILLVLEARQERLISAAQDADPASLESLFELLLSHLP